MDTSGSLERRGRTLEDEFFYRVDKKLAEELRARLAIEHQKAALSRISGVTDEDVLDDLVAAHITTESFVALTLVPLSQVAWADGTMDVLERAAILKAAVESQIVEGSVSYELLQSWLEHCPPASLYEAWVAYTQALCSQLSEGARNNLRDQIVARARKVAMSAGGILGIHAISAKEEAVLEEIARVFSTV